MNVRLINAYQRMCKETLHEPLSCIHKGHPPLVPIVGWDSTLDNIRMRCVGCDYEVLLGLRRYEEMRTSLEHYYGRSFRDVL